MYIYLSVLIQSSGVYLHLSPLYEYHLCCDYGVLPEKKEGKGWGLLVEAELAFPEKCGDLPEPPQWQ